jgi:hypothetical protein
MNINSDKFYIGIGKNYSTINDLNIGIAERKKSRNNGYMKHQFIAKDILMI